MKKQIQKVLENIIQDLYNIDTSIENLDTPPKKDMWDFAFGCFLLAKELRKWPPQIATELAAHISENNINEFESVSVAGPYLNIKINTKFFIESFLEFVSWDYLEVSEKKSWNVIVDYIWANVWKPLHIGHMCTPNIGSVIINLNRKFGYDVIGDSHIGDWGIIFGKLIVAYKKYWDEKKLESDAVDHLFEIYVKISSDADDDETLEDVFRQTFKDLSDWNTELVNLWKSFTGHSIEAMRHQLNRMNVQPDYDVWESFYEWIGLPKMQDYPDLKWNMHDIVNELVEKWIATKNDDNSVWVVFPDEAKLSSCILQKRNGTHWYLASDLACIKYRQDNWNPEKIIYSVDVRQQLHFQQCFYIAAAAGWISADKLTHAYSWFIALKDGAMSTRKGRIIKLDKLLDEAEEKAKGIILEKRDDISGQELEKLGKIIGIWAIKYGYLKKTRESDVIFDWDEFMTFEGNSWPYIQYAYVRATRILEKLLEDVSIKDIDITQMLDTDLQLEELEFVKLFWEYEDMLIEALDKNAPHLIAAYAYNLTKKFSSFYNATSVIHEKDVQKRNLRIVFVQTFMRYIEDSFALLWIDLPDKM